MYNKYMGGVDREDQLHDYYSCKIKSNKFIAFYHFNVTITNLLTKKLIVNYCSQVRCGCNGGLSPCHFPIKIRGDNNKLKGG